MDAEECCHAKAPDLSSANGAAPMETASADRLLVERLRCGDTDAGYQFFCDFYPGVYRFLFWLTQRTEQAEDLAQETFVRAWRHLDRFDPRWSLRAWLHRIAHREFLRSLRRDAPAQLSAVGEVAAPQAAGFTDAVVVRHLLRSLPAEQRELVLLHDLEGYTSDEISRIVGLAARTVRRRLEQARERLRQELGEDDLTYLNEPLAPMRQWAWLPLDQMHALENRFSLRGEEITMERREFLRQAAAGAVGLAASAPDKEVVDGRLAQKVTLAFKATALSELCDHLRKETRVHMTAGASVADEKVTLFCKSLPLRDVMRQLSRPFGYAWVRSTRNAQYRYELVQDLRSQLLEEELRNRDRHAALLALDRDMERYREYLDLSPLEAEARLKTAAPAAKPLLEKLAGVGWGPIQMYFRLSREEQEALRAGQELLFTTKPETGERQLPPEVARGVFQSYRDHRVHKGDEIWEFVPLDLARPDDPVLTDVPEVCAGVRLQMTQSELGTLTLNGVSRIFFPRGAGAARGQGPFGSGRSPAVLKLENATLNARFAAHSALRPLVTVQPKPSYHPVAGAEGAPPPEPGVTSADLLEALHRATGLPVVGDYFTQLFPPAEVSARNMPLYPALNRLADAMRLRWTLADGNWLQFRSVSYYDDRLKEVPNRLLARWSAARRQKGVLSIDDLVEIVRLPDAQLDGREMAQGAREIWGLREWDLPRNRILRPHLRFVALLSPEQRQRALSDAGLPFTQMPLAQQQQFISHSTLYDPIPLQGFSGGVLRVDYTQPGGFQWGDPGLSWSWSRWFIVREHGPQGHWTPRPSIQGRTREAVREALLRLDPGIRDLAVHKLGAPAPISAPTAPVPLEAQIFPSELSLVFLYIPSSSNEHAIHIVAPNMDAWQLLR
jgi:RNA polymerase sigma-70 factor (ECF subfamily)